MMANKDDLGDRMKSYEQVTRGVLLPHSLTILRVDGRAFHSYLRGAEKPYDFGFMEDMQFVAAALCREISGTLFAYGQSDEISLIMDDRASQSQSWFGGVIQKMVSVASGIATAALLAQRGLIPMAHFDARVFTVPSWTEAGNYMIWRQRDAVRNSISMAAQAKFSPKELHGKNSGEMQNMLWNWYEINWNDYPIEAKRGWVVVRNVREAEVSYVDKRTQQHEEGWATRSFWEPEPAPHFWLGQGLLIDPNTIEPDKGTAV